MCVPHTLYRHSKPFPKVQIIAGGFGVCRVSGGDDFLFFVFLYMGYGGCGLGSGVWTRLGP